MNQPNILFISVDDLNNWPACLGKYPGAITPNIDRLAARGTLFSNAHCPAPICLPARSAVLSGIAPATSGCYFNATGLDDEHPWTRSPAFADAVPLPIFFHRNGYRTLGSGKVFHKFLDEERDSERHVGEAMWDETNTGEVLTPRGEAGAGQQFPWRSPAFKPFQDAIDPSGFAFHWGPQPDSKTAAFSDVMIADWCAGQLRKPQTQPFFLAAGFLRPHTPMVAPQRFFDLYDPAKIPVPEPNEAVFDALPEIAKQIALEAGGNETLGGQHKKLHGQNRAREAVHAYLACTSFMDDCLGKVLDALEEGPHAGNTIIVFWSDHGWGLGDHFHWKKWALWESVTNVPLIIARPDAAPAVCETPVSTLDIYPTLADLCGLPQRAEWDGHSLTPLLADPKTSGHHPAITSYGRGNHSVRSNDGTLIHYADGSEELYLPADLPEEQNRAADPAHAELRARLARHLPANPAVPLCETDVDLANLSQGDVARFACPSDLMIGKPLTLRASIDLRGDNGVIIAHHHLSAGYALTIEDRRPVFRFLNVTRPLRWDAFEPQTFAIRSPEPLPEGQHEIVVQMDCSGQVSLIVNDRLAAEGPTNGPLSLHITGLLTVGRLSDNLHHPRFLPTNAIPPWPMPGEVAQASVHFTQIP